MSLLTIDNMGNEHVNITHKHNYQTDPFDFAVKVSGNFDLLYLT